MARRSGKAVASAVSNVAITPAHSAATLPEIGFVRLPAILGVIPVGKSTWWRWVRQKKAPAPIKLSEMVTAWRAQDIHDFIVRLEREGAA